MSPPDRETPTGEVVLHPSDDLFAGVGEGALRESHRRLQLLYTLGRQVGGEVDADRVLEAVVDAVGRLIAPERCFVATAGEGGRLTCRRASGITLGPDPAGWPVSRTVLHRALTDGVSVLSCDAAADPLFADVSSLGLHGVRAVMCVPLGRPGAGGGVLYVDSRLKSGLFTPADLSFLTALAHSAHLALRNADDLAAARRARTESEARCAVLQEGLMREHKVVGRSPKLADAFHRLQRVARGEVPVLLLGETGTGKEVFARAAHALSKRHARPFLPVNIAALSETVVESELFGHEKGAFTGAAGRRLGRWELADGGTLFLDEVAEVPPAVQAKLLRVLESGEFERVGGTDRLRSDVRLVCATHRDLRAMVAAGTFREDFFYRVSGVTVHLPPLRERPGDLPLLAADALRRAGSTKSLSPAALARLEAEAWPGNVRQLARVVQAAAELCDGEVIGPDDLAPFLDPGPTPADRLPTWREVVERAERDHLLRVLAATGGNCDEAIRQLGMAKATFYDRKKRYGL